MSLVTTLMFRTGEGSIGRMSPTAALVFFLLLESANEAASKNIHSVAGPFRVVPRYVAQCPPDLRPAQPLEFHVTQVRDRHNPDLWVYNANFTTLFTWTNDQDFDINMASWSSRGGWKENAYIFKVKHYCSALRAYAPSLWRKIMLAVNGNANDYCPWPPGTYTVTNFTNEFSVQAMPAFYYGKWRATIRLMEDNWKVTLGCLMGYADTLPRL